MADWPSGDIQANGIRLHYTRSSGGSGGASPPLARSVAHGFSDDGLCWTPVADALAPDYDVVMVDARGHGRSEAPPDGYGPVEHADDLAGVIAGLGLRQPILLGHSMGAMTAARSPWPAAIRTSRAPSCSKTRRRSQHPPRPIRLLPANRPRLPGRSSLSLTRANVLALLHPSSFILHTSSLCY